MATAGTELTYGIQECSKCTYKIRCEECVYNKKSIKQIIVETRKETAKRFADLVEFHSVSTRDEDGHETFTISALCLKEILREEFGVEE